MTTSTSSPKAATEAKTRGAALAARFAAIHGATLTTVAACTGEQWRQPTGAEGWPVAIVAHHIAEVAGFFVGPLAALGSGSGEPVVLTAAGVEANNARHARDHAEVTKAETVDALRTNGAAIEQVLHDLADDQTNAVMVVFEGNEMTAAQAVEGALIGHFEQHLASIRATVDSAGGTGAGLA